jgi:hypothetical protein
MIFSPRKIMFQYQLAIWECNNDSWHESSLCTIPTPLKASTFRPTVSPWQSRIEISAWPDIHQYISLAHDYARRKLTYGDDALHAITSLLSVMSTSFFGGFITGLPEMFFDEALLWQPAEPMQQRQSSEGRLAIPSWSWVGWEGEIMTVDWKHYFYHLHRSGRWLVKIASNTALGRSNLNRPDIPVIPAVTWFYGQTLLERFPVKASGHTNIKYMTDVSLPLPPGWARINSGYLFGGQENKFSAYPLPISSNQVSRTVSARYLFGRTTRAYLKSAKGTKYPILSSERVTQLSTHLKDSSGHLIGEVNLNLAQLNFQEPKAQTEFELVVISAGEISGTAQVGEGAYGGTASVHRLSLPDGFGWAKSHFDFPLGLMSSTKSTTPVHQLIGIYHVLWIEWENGIAYRKGLGRVLKEAWDRMATEEIDLVLG